MVQESAYTDSEAHADECVSASSGAYNESKYPSRSHRI